MSGPCGSAPGWPPSPRHLPPLANDKRAGTGDPAWPLEETKLRSRCSIHAEGLLLLCTRPRASVHPSSCPPTHRLPTGSL